MNTSAKLDIQAIKWEIARFTKGICLEITESPIKCFEQHIQVSDMPFEYGIQRIRADVQLKSLKDLSLFADEQIDAILLQRSIDVVDLNEINRILKYSAYFITVSISGFTDDRFTRVLENEELQTIIYRKERQK